MTKTTASLRVMGIELEPEKVTVALDLSPDHAHRKGDARISSSGREYADYAEGLWSLSSTTAPQMEAKEHVRDLVSRLAGKESALRELREQGLRVDIFIGVFGASGNLGISIPFELLVSVVNLGLSLELDLYDH